MKHHKPIFWHQGLFLQPHHFQQMDLYTQSLLTPYSRFLQPHFWGIGHLEIKETALGNRTFTIDRAEWMFPDMSYLVCPDNTLVEHRSFDEASVEGGKPLTVYMGIRKLNEFQPNVTVLTDPEKLSEVTTRFAAITADEDLPDLYQAGPPAQVNKIYYVLKVFWETEIEKLSDYILMPVAQLEWSGEDIVLSQSFVPPCLSVIASNVLWKLINEMRDEIVSRGRQMEAYKKERGVHTAEFGARDMVYLLALRSLNRYIPLLFHLTEKKDVHPWPVYGLIRQLIGELSSFSENIGVTGEDKDGIRWLLKYDHQNLWDCFSKARALVTKLLEEITSGPEYILELLFDSTYYVTEISPAVFEGRNRFYLVVESEEDPQSILQPLTTIAKLSSRETLPLMIARALPGVKFHHLPFPPQELPRRARALYFEIDHHSVPWAEVQKNNNIALYWDSAPHDLKVQLMISGRS